GTSYLVHDFYRRFIRRDASETHYVMIGRIVTGLLMLLAALLTFVLDSAKQSFDLMLSVGAGTGLIYLLRWFWWRINAWSEIAAMVSSFLIAVGFFVAGKMGVNIAPHATLVLTVVPTTIIWIAVTFITRPTDKARLIEFYRLVKPAGPGWRRIRSEAGPGGSPDRISQSRLRWAVGWAGGEGAA